jgi:signal transduction histidine kinase
MTGTRELGFLSGGGEMGARMRALDWTNTAVGDPAEWPQTLRSAVSTCIGSRFPIVLYWGVERVVLYNDAYAEILGTKHPWALGRPCREVWSEIWHLIEPMLDSVAATGEATWSEDQFLPLERRGFPEECYFSFSFSPVRAEDGHVEGIFTAVIENTRRVLGERRLALLRELAARNASARSAREACALAMETLAEHGQDVPFALAYFGDELQAATPGAAAACAAARPDLVKELPIPGGRLVAGVNPRRPYDDHYAAFLGLVADQIATAVANARAYEEERKRAEVLAEVDRAKTAFFSNISHEFRTPLTLMLGPLEDALAEPSSSRAQHDCIELAHRNAQRLLKLVNTLLDFSRIEASRAAVRFEATDLGVFTAELASVFRSTVERAGLQLVVDCPPFGESVRVDREMWEKIVFNLLSNAFKFTFEGKIAVCVRREGTHAVLTVTDTGIGMPAEELPHIFERFHRVKDARGRSFEGSGIGLALVQELVKLHGGEVTVSSVVGAGSTFTVTVPLASDADATASAAAQPIVSDRAAAYVQELQSWLPAEHAQRQPAAARSDARARILLADDNADMRSYVYRLLAPEYDVTAASDGLAALDAARSGGFDLVIVDVMMPKLDGFGVVSALRDDERMRTVPVILLSARAGEESRVEGMRAGADDYIVKPFSARELLVRVGALLRAAELRAEADRHKDEFLATLAHELRNPLAPLRNALYLLRTTDHDGSIPIQDIMERQLNHLVRLVDDLLEMSRISRGALDLHKERLDVAEVMRTAVETSQPLIEAGQHTLELDLPRQPLWVDGDPVRVAQIVSNLLNNSAKYTEPGGRIVLSAHDGGGVVRISVRDNGPGIASDVLPRLFEMFSRGEYHSARQQGGLGIGLALSRRLAEMHGGTITVRSDGVGGGAEFVVTLPLAQAQTSPTADDKAPLASLPPRRIMVVDDNHDAAESLSMVLKFLGADVRVAHDGHEALAAFETYEPAVVLLDIGMPGMDGYEVARRMRASDPQRRTALVALTGWGQGEDLERARQAGFDRHLIKPADIAALQALLSSL